MTFRRDPCPECGGAGTVSMACCLAVDTVHLCFCPRPRRGFRTVACDACHGTGWLYSCPACRSDAIDLDDGHPVRCGDCGHVPLDHPALPFPTPAQESA